MWILLCVCLLLCGQPAAGSAAPAAQDASASQQARVTLKPSEAGNDGFAWSVSVFIIYQRSQLRPPSSARAALTAVRGASSIPH
jgi:hypothetical protein